MEELEQRACPAAVSISGPTQINETDSAAQIVVRLSAPVSSPVTVGYSVEATAATATFGRDYRLTLGTLQLKPTGTLTFQRGQTSQVITIRPLDDLLREGDERFTMSLQRAGNASLAPGASAATVTIKDNDNYTASIVGPSIVQPGVTTEYTLQLSSPATQRETFYVSTWGGTAKVTDDYRPLTRVPVTILPGKTTAIVRLVTVANSSVDYDKTVFLKVEPATPGFPPPTPFQVTIPGPLGPRPPSISISDVSVIEGAAGTTTTANFVVTLSTAWGQPVSVNFATADGTATAADSDYVATSGTLTFAPGELSKAISVTVVGDAKAEANETFQLMLSSAFNGILARSSATGTITNDDGTAEPAYKIVVVFPDSSLTPSQQSVFLQAAARWSQIIVGDVPDVTYQGRVIDDLEITATAPKIDGVGGILGQAGPTALRTGGDGLPYLGKMEFDAADVASMVQDGSFAEVIQHEMGHVLGFGTLWNYGNHKLVQGLGTSNPVFVGTNAVREYQTLTGTAVTSVPVENTGGQGTAGGHWRESVFNTELMTGYAEAPGVRMPISRMTVGSLADLGYVVDYSAADSYTLGLRQAALDFHRLQLSPASARQMFLGSGNPSVASLFSAVAFGTGSDTATSKMFRALGSPRA
jgi:hypothetical protein